MISNWLFKVGSSIPGGYSRRYVLGLLRQHSMLTTKEIIGKAIEHSEGRWRPSPGLIYHLLGKLLAEGLINEMDNGRYSVTKKGIDMLTDIESARNILQKQIDILSQISNVIKLGIDRLSNAGSVLTSILKIGKRTLHLETQQPGIYIPSNSKRTRKCNVYRTFHYIAYNSQTVWSQHQVLFLISHKKLLGHPLQHTNNRLNSKIER